MKDLLDPKIDFVFKRIFGSEDNTDLLLAFLNRTFQESGEPPLTEIVLMNPYTDKDSPQDKQSIFDIQAKTTEGELINIEMQLFNRYDNEKRTLYYWSKQYASQLEEGQSYKILKKCVTINILNFSILPNDQYHNVFHLREDRSHISLIDDIEIHFLELSKLDKQQITTSGGLLNWLLFLKSDNTDNWEVLKMQEPELEKAMTVLEFLSQDKEARRRYEMRQKALHDEASLREGAREEGQREGELQGKLKGKLEVASNMLAKGMNIETVSEFTGISIEELKKLAQSH
ncbi:Rpn family recombination-promoting nuclease/putative transposase [Paenibacillus oryzisoli]|uniref:Rpn family recombination-promoting nuclease/putative transposase n=1 Tax=Paenibacillus oryzisoli TaxID=1850517 RepID=UPI003D2B21B0